MSKTINETFTDQEYNALIQQKGNKRWHEFILTLLPSTAILNTNTKSETPQIQTIIGDQVYLPKEQQNSSNNASYDELNDIEREIVDRLAVEYETMDRNRAEHFKQILKKANSKHSLAYLLSINFKNKGIVPQNP